MRHAIVFMLMIPLVLVASGASGWTLRLDIDTDFDPSTLELSTNDTSAEIALHLWPDYSGEPISEISFILGGSCTQCGPPEESALLMECGLWYADQDWMNHPAFQTTWHDVATCIDCCDEEETGLWLGNVYGASADPAFAPEVPVTLVRFPAQTLGGPGPHCPSMYKRLSVFVGEEHHEVILDADGVIAVAQMSWSTLKGRYR
jgi:hypothetical protein